LRELEYFTVHVATTERPFDFSSLMSFNFYLGISTRLVSVVGFTAFIAGSQNVCNRHHIIISLSANFLGLLSLSVSQTVQTLRISRGKNSDNKYI
jgi:hypothetical protein